jgi:hypothetical protein
VFRIFYRLLTALACLGARSGRSKELEIIVGAARIDTNANHLTATNGMDRVVRAA